MQSSTIRRGLAALALAVLAVALAAPAGAGTAQIAADRYVVLFAGTQGPDGFEFAQSRQAALGAVTAAGGTVTNDLSRQIGTVVVEAPSGAVADALAASPLVESVGNDFSWQALPARVPDSGPEQTADPLEALQWDMDQINQPEAHNVQSGGRSVDVGILDSGIDGRHPDFFVDGRGTNVVPAGTTRSRSFRRDRAWAHPMCARTTSSTGRTWPAPSPPRRTASGSSASRRT